MAPDEPPNLASAPKLDKSNALVVTLYLSLIASLMIFLLSSESGVIFMNLFLSIPPTVPRNFPLIALLKHQNPSTMSFTFKIRGLKIFLTSLVVLFHLLWMVLPYHRHILLKRLQAYCCQISCDHLCQFFRLRVFGRRLFYCRLLLFAKLCWYSHLYANATSCLCCRDHCNSFFYLLVHSLSL